MVDIRTEAALGFLGSQTQDKKLKREKQNIYDNNLPSHTISVVDFPGFSREKSMGSFTTNIAVESLNYYCCNNYIKLLDTLNRENIKMPILYTPNCKHLVDLCLSRSSGLVQFLSASAQEFKEYLKELRNVEENSNLPYKDIFSFINKTEIVYHFSWGSVKYDLMQIRQDALGHYSPHLNSFFLRRCGSKMISQLSSMLPNYYPNQMQLPSMPPSESVFAEKLTQFISGLIQPLIKTEPHIIYCLKAPEKEIHSNSVFLFRNSLILPTLLWTWYGYPH